MNNKEISPFTPGNPVPVELFVGRSEQIREILRYAKQASLGRQENIFLSGERGIGKSSLASFLRYLIVKKESFVGIHVFLGGVSTLEELMRRIFEQLLKETKDQVWFEEIANFFGKYIEEVGLFGVSLGFRPPDKELKDLARHFPEVLQNIIEKIKDKKKGLFIALDDINGLARTPDFANWYKSFVDEVTTQYQKFPVFIMPIGLPEVRDTLSKEQPSLMRIFRVTEIEKLSNKEVEGFFSTAFEKVNIRVSSDAMKTVVQYSSGLPILMHEIGDAIFWQDRDGVIDTEEASVGVVRASKIVGRKYLDPQVYRVIRSERYRAILRKLGEEASLTRFFKKKEIEKRLKGGEKKVFHNFLRRMQGLGIIRADMERGRGTYTFVNELYPIYIVMESMREQKRSKI